MTVDLQPLFLFVGQLENSIYPNSKTVFNQFEDVTKFLPNIKDPIIKSFDTLSQIRHHCLAIALHAKQYYGILQPFVLLITKCY